MPNKEQIKKLIAKGLTYREIGEKFNTSKQRIHQILTGYNSPLSLAKRLRRKQNEEKLIQLKKKIFGKIIPGNITQITGIKSGSRDRYRELIRIRDNHTCQMCGIKWISGTRRLDIHHLDEDPSKTRQVDDLIKEANNLVTLCHECHLGIEGHRKAMSLKGRKKKQVTNTPFKQAV